MWNGIVKGYYDSKGLQAAIDEVTALESQQGK